MDPARQGLRVVPLELSEANAAVQAWHRHHDRVQGHRFSLGVVDGDGNLHGAAIVGRPVAFGTPRSTLEVVRLVTDGTINACSILYAAAARAGRAMGFERIQTYILDAEPGTSLRAAGWTYEGLSRRDIRWHTRPGRKPKDEHGAKGRWSKLLNAQQPAVQGIPRLSDEPPSLFDEAS